jgi:hypothetical protein
MFNNFFTKIVSFLDDVEKYGEVRQATHVNIIWSMRFVCLITKARHTLGVYNTYCFSTAIMVSRTRLNVTFTRTLSPLYFFSRVPLSQYKTRTRGSGFDVKLMKIMFQVCSLARAPSKVLGGEPVMP